MQTFPTFSLLIPRKFVSLRPTQVARKGERVKLLWYKGRLRTLSSTSESRKFNVSEDTQPKRLRGMYCMLSVLLTVPIYHGVGYLELLILRQGSARARMWDRREVEFPRFCFLRLMIIELLKFRQLERAAMNKELMQPYDNEKSVFIRTLQFLCSKLYIKDIKNYSMVTYNYYQIKLQL